MKKINFKLFLIVPILFGTIFFPSKDILAQSNNNQDPKIGVETTGYSILGPDTFVFSGLYFGNIQKQGITTYFEFKKNDENLSVDAETTIPIVRDSNVSESNYFFSSPELNKFSVYYFRAVGYLNDDPSVKFFGETMSIRTGDLYYPTGYGLMSDGSFIPYTITFKNPDQPVKYTLPATTPSSTISAPTNFTAVPGSCGTGEIDLKWNSSNGTIFSIQDEAREVYYGSGFSFKDTGLVEGSSHTYTIVAIDFNTSSSSNPISVSALAPQKCDENNNGSGGNSNDSGSTKGKTGLVPCTDDCTFNDLMTLINTVVKFILLDLAIPFAAIMFAYAGFEMLTSGGSTEKKSQAISIFTNVAIGLVIVASAYLIVHTVLIIVGYQSSWNWFGF